MTEKLYFPLSYAQEVTPLLLPEKNHGVKITENYNWFLVITGVIVGWIVLLLIYIPFMVNNSVNVTLLINLFFTGSIGSISFFLYRAGLKLKKRLQELMRMNQELYEMRILKPFVRLGYSAPDLSSYELRSLMKGHSVPILLNDETKTVILVRDDEDELVLADYSTGDYVEVKDPHGRLTNFPAYSIQDVVTGKVSS